MPGRSRAGWLALVATMSTSGGLAAAPHSPPVPIEGSEQETAAAAEQLFRLGRQLLEEGKLAAACDAFAQSLQRKTSPGTLLNLGRCREAEGHLPQALLLASRALEAANAEPEQAKRRAWQRGAKIESDRLRRTVARLDLKEVDRDGWRILVDQRERSELVTEASRPHEVLLNPGNHRIELFHPTHPAAVQEVAVNAGQVKRLAAPAAAAPTQTVADEWTADLQPAQFDASPLSEPAEARENLQASSDSRWVSTALLVAGGTFLAAGVGTGLNTLRLADGLTESCLDEACSGSNALAVANYWATSTNVLFSAGLVSLGVGVFLAWGDETDSSSAAVQVQTQCHLRYCGAQALFSF